ncbi:MAG: septum formation inhibitor Maf [Deltaproteobacteria bacterium]|nr:septum formation inhibitor Maf [Deltaproteobacteria bacterium]
MVRHPLVLGSGSPRRRELLTLVGLSFEVHVTDVPEEPLDGEAPGEHARRLARDKARAASLAAPRAIALGADTIVVLDGEVLGKPRDAADAVAMLTRLSARPHQVLTGFALAEGGNVRCSDVVRTEVDFRAVSAREIEAYVATGEPLDKAGGYGIQGRAAAFVATIRGSYTNVVGLPLVEVLEALLELGAIAPHGSAP